jgi:hypothetical protein
MAEEAQNHQVMRRVVEFPSINVMHVKKMRMSSQVDVTILALPVCLFSVVIGDSNPIFWVISYAMNRSASTLRGPILSVHIIKIVSIGISEVILV